jgi:NAD(P)-dependent dehydrogenase (short-subunit alcohol dehydrogenase family)
MAGVLDGVVALVTGAGGGIGSATVAAMLEGRREVVATDLTAPTGGTLNLAQDVTSEADWAAVAAAVEQRWGRLDALVNNAGIAVVGTIEGTASADWRRQMAVNVDSMLLSLQATLPLLKTSGQSRRGGASVCEPLVGGRASAGRR